MNECKADASLMVLRGVLGRRENVANKVAGVLKKAERKARVDEDEYVDNELRRWSRLYAWLKRGDAVSLCTCVCWLIFYFMLTGISRLFCSDIWVSLGFAFIISSMFILVRRLLEEMVRSWVLKRSFLYFWQHYASHVYEEAASEGVSDLELELGIRALRESRLMMERLVKMMLAIFIGSCGLLPQMFDLKLTQVFAVLGLGFVPSRPNMIACVLLLVLCVFLYTVFIVAPKQWDRQLDLYMRLSSSKK